MSSDCHETFFFTRNVQATAPPLPSRTHAFITRFFLSIPPNQNAGLSLVAKGISKKPACRRSIEKSLCTMKKKKATAMISASYLASQTRRLLLSLAR